MKSYQLIFTTREMKFSIKDFFSKCDQILNGKIHFLCSDYCLKDFALNSHKDSLEQTHFVLFKQF